MVNYYAIKSIDGKVVNQILNNWKLCKGKVHNHRAIYKGFEKLEDAINYLGCANKIRFCGFGKEITPNRGKAHKSHKPIPQYSKGERLVERYLKFLGVDYVTQYNTLCCINPKTGKQLPYDFELPNEKIIIEVQGEEHYKYIKAFHKDYAEFEYQQYRDTVKREFATENGYTFIELKWSKKHSYSWVVTKLQEFGLGGVENGGNR